MRVRTFVGILLALVVVVLVSYLSNQNPELLLDRFQLSSSRSVPLYLALLGVFLLGFLPAVSVLLTQTLKRDLEQRRERRRSREAKSLRGGFRRSVDLAVDGQWSKAGTELESFLIETPEDFGALLRYGEVLRRQGRTEEALEVHRRASVLYPQSVAVLYQLAEDYEANGEAEVARQIRDRILRDFPGCGLRVLRRRRDAALAERNWRRAAREQERIESLLAEGGEELVQEPEQGVRIGLAYQRAVDLLEHERVDEAREGLLDALKGEPTFLPAMILLGEAELVRGDSRAAVEEWQHGFEATGSAVFLQRIEDHYIENEQPLQAIETLHRFMAAAESDLLPRFFLGRLYSRLEMHEEALKTLSELKDRIASSPTYHCLLARIHERRGEMGMALESLYECVREAGAEADEFVCSSCGARTADWRARCHTCGSWNTVDLDFQEDELSAVPRRPNWEIFHGSGDEPDH